VNMVMNLWIPLKAGSFLTSWAYYQLLMKDSAA
jgi:hypothetical protein